MIFPSVQKQTEIRGTLAPSLGFVSARTTRSPPTPPPPHPCTHPHKSLRGIYKASREGVGGGGIRGARYQTTRGLVEPQELSRPMGRWSPRSFSRSLPESSLLRGKRRESRTRPTYDRHISFLARLSFMWVGRGKLLKKALMWEPNQFSTSEVDFSLSYAFFFFWFWLSFHHHRSWCPSRCFFHVHFSF